MAGSEQRRRPGLSRVAAWGLVLAVAGPGARAAMAGSTFDVRAFGAKGDGVADDVRAIQAAIDAAVASGPGAVVRLPKGRYRLASPGVDPRFYFRLPRDAQDLTVRGEAGTVLLTAAGKRPFLADGCRGCAISDLTIDFAAPNVTQGVVTAVDLARKAVTIKLDVGYPMPDAATFTADARYTPALNLLRPGRKTFDWSRRSAIKSVAGAGDTWTFITGRTPAAADVGRRAFVWGRQQDEWTPLVEMREVDGFTIDHVNDYAGGGFAGGGRSGTIRIRRFYSGPPPASDRLGFYGGHQGHSRADIEISDSQWLMSNDDDMNALTELHDVVGHPQPDAIEVRHAGDYQAGDTVAIWDYADINAVHVRDTAKVLRVERPPGDASPRLILDKPVTIERFGPRGDLKPNDDPHDRVVNLSSGGKITLRNCSFSSSFAHPLLLKSARGIDIRGCRIFGSDMSGLDCGMQTFWNEGPQTCDLIVRDNLFYDIDGISCRVGIEVPGGTARTSRDQRRIDIRDNVFLSGGRGPVWNNIMPRGVAVLLGNVSNAVVQDNLFCDFANANVVIYSAEDVSVTGNLFLDAGGGVGLGEGTSWKGSANVDATSLVSIDEAVRVVLTGNVVAGGPTRVAVGKRTSGIIDARDGVRPVTPRVYAPDAASDNDAPLTVDAPVAGRYAAVLEYRNASTDADGIGRRVTRRVIVNDDGNAATQLNFAYTGDFDADAPSVRAVVRVTLRAGRNTIRLDGKDGSVSVGRWTLCPLPSP